MVYEWSMRRRQYHPVVLCFLMLCDTHRALVSRVTGTESCIGIQRASLTASEWFDKVQLVIYAGVMEDLPLI
jgi:hypothetical protein